MSLSQHEVTATLQEPQPIKKALLEKGEIKETSEGHGVKRVDLGWAVGNRSVCKNILDLKENRSPSQILMTVLAEGRSHRKQGNGREQGRNQCKLIKSFNFTGVEANTTLRGNLPLLSIAAMFRP